MLVHVHAYTRSVCTFQTCIRMATQTLQRNARVPHHACINSQAATLELISMNKYIVVSPCICVHVLESSKTNINLDLVSLFAHQAGRRSRLGRNVGTGLNSSYAIAARHLVYGTRKILLRTHQFLSPTQTHFHLALIMIQS